MPAPTAKQVRHALAWVEGHFRRLEFSRWADKVKYLRVDDNPIQAVLALNDIRKEFKRDYKVLLEGPLARPGPEHTEGYERVPRPKCPKEPAGPPGTPAFAKRMKAWNALMDEWEAGKREFRQSQIAARSAVDMLGNAIAVLKQDPLLDLMADGEAIRHEVLGPRTGGGKAKQNPAGRYDLSPKERVILRTLGPALEDLGFQMDEEIRHYIDHPDEPPVTFLSRIRSDVGPGGHGWRHVGPGSEPTWARFDRSGYDTEEDAREAFVADLASWKEDAAPYFKAHEIVSQAIRTLLNKNPKR